MSQYFKKTDGERVKLPVFYPDATQAVIRTLDSRDIEESKTPGVLVNTYHLWRNLGSEVLKKTDGIRNLMNYQGAVISDSGGFQVMSIAKKQSKKAVRDEGVYFKPMNSKRKILFTPEDSIKFQMKIKPDMVVVLDDFTPPGADRKIAEETVVRTIDWARRSRQEFEKQCKEQKLTKEETPYLLAVVQGGDYLDLRRECARELTKIGFDGFGYGGWPINERGEFNYQVADVIAEEAPKDYLLYGMGIGKPEEVVGCAARGYTIFDCVLPTRDGRHKRLYVFNAKEKDEIDVNTDKFYSYYTPDKQKYYRDTRPVSEVCDCQLCKNYSRAYLAHLFRINEMSAMRLATIHNLRFYSMLMEKLGK